MNPYKRRSRKYASQVQPNGGFGDRMSLSAAAYTAERLEPQISTTVITNLVTNLNMWAGSHASQQGK